jgi:hypothetical protein
MSFFDLTSYLFWNEGGAYVFYAQSPVPGDYLRWMHSRRDAGAVYVLPTRTARTTGTGDGIQGIHCHRGLPDPVSPTIS